MQSKNNFIKGLSLIIFILIVAISCGNNPTDYGKFHKNHNLLLGTWTSTYNETFIYDGLTFTSAYSGSTTYKMEAEKIIWSSDYSGIIYGQYTENTYLPEVVGLYYAVSFKDLSRNEVSISGAYKQDGKTGGIILEEAITEFTIENGYFGTYSDCERTK